MTYTAVIEIPRGDDRRRHLSFAKDGFVDLGPIKDVIPVNDGVMPVHYGYIEKTKNVTEGDEVDSLILSDKEFRVGDKVGVFPVALLRRDDGDDKIIAVDDEHSPLKAWEDVPEKDRTVILEFFGYNHKIIGVEGSDAAYAYLHNTSL